MADTPTLETERLVLRPISLDDAPGFQKYFYDWEIVKYVSGSVSPPYPDNGAEEYIKNTVLPDLEKGEAFAWAIVPKSGEDKGTAIGNIYYRLKKQLPDNDRGFWLARKYHGQGLMTEAIFRTQDFMFFEYGWKSFRVKNAIGNHASRRVKEKCGAVLIGEEEGPSAHMPGPTQIWEVTREHWEKIKKALD